MKDYKTFLSTRQETWHDALIRYKRFLEADMKDYFPVPYSYSFIGNKGYAFQEVDKISPSVLERFSEETGVKVPDDLFDLMCNKGAFQIGESLFNFFSEKEQVIMTLSEVLQYHGYSDYLELIKRGMLRSMSGFYFFFASTFVQKDEVTILYFSKGGYFGLMNISRINPLVFFKKTLPSMFNGSAEKLTLDTLISSQIDRIILNALVVRGYID